MTERTLVLLRHAKAETAAGGTPDVNRPLTARGHADAAAAGAWLAHHGLVPDHVLCSPARRTRQTWHGIAVALSDSAPDAPGPQVVYDTALYEGASPAVLDILHQIDPDARVLLVVGHNPTVSLLSATLAGPGAAVEGLRTCGIVVHDVPGSWIDCGPGSAALRLAHTARAGDG